eukprot:TRINITY_DN91844_c0_g1_i1.p1 TRINITY_DN91844_c0_g1~~TRINITY_DN91844_c0_g1_i1.p1  ORF type:complete len:366 (-),score=99.41 TRINITY_DN91844_c0_g1_i1:164-1261(-)
MDEEDDLFIEQLLDSLEASFESDAEKEHGEVDLGAASIACALTLPEQDDSAKSDAGSETSLGSVLNRFCVDGDESSVDALLDKFLGSDTDASKLIEALGQTMLEEPRSSNTKPTDSKNKKMFLPLDKLESARERNGLDPFEALLGSARGVLQSARKHVAKRMRPHSAHPALGLPSDADASAGGRSASKSSKASRTKSGPSSKTRLSSEQGTSREAAPSVEPAKPPCAASEAAVSVEDVVIPCEQEQVNTAVAPEGTRADVEGSGVDVSLPEAREKVIARIAEMDDPEEVRVFMKRLLLGVRRRYMATASAEQGGELDAGNDEYSDDFDDSEDEVVSVSAHSSSMSEPPADEGKGDGNESEYSNYD